MLQLIFFSRSLKRTHVPFSLIKTFGRAPHLKTNMVSASILLAVHVAIGWTGVAVGLAALVSRIPVRPFTYLLPWHKWLGRLFVLLMYFMPGQVHTAPFSLRPHIDSSSFGELT